jgi:hypothetical protein
MATTPTPYEQTSVPAARSQEQITKLLRAFGCSGVQFDTDFETGRCIVRFGIRKETALQVVRLEVQPLPPERLKRGSGWRVSAEQRERQAWRGLHHYLEGNLKAAEFGLVRFEDIFLAHFELDPAHGDNRTLSQALRPALEAGIPLIDAMSRKQLPAGPSTS